MRSRFILPALVAAVLATSLSVAASHGGFELLSAQEYKSELTARAAPNATLITKSADLDAPTITVVRPDRSADIQPPVDIDVRFKAAAGSTVNVSSLKITYGFLRLDITQRILGAPGVKVTADGLKASGAQLPVGSHKLVIEIADNIGRTGRQPLEFTIRKAS
jgi:hypothetical protein